MKKIRFLTAGESHGKALMGIIEGLPSRLDISAEEINHQLARRQMGYGRGRRMQIEKDQVDILTGIRHGYTLGSPIGFVIHNKDWKNWVDIMQSEPFEGEIKRQVSVPRPGHADLVGGIKYQHEDMRNVLERSSARETTMRVALGAVARCFLKRLGIEIGSRVVQIGPHQDNSTFEMTLPELNDHLDSTPLRCIDEDLTQTMMAEIDKAKQEGNTLGGIFEVYADGLPVGLGSYTQWDRKLEGHLGQAFLSMNAFKGVELGLGFEAGKVYGSDAHDEMGPGETPKQVNYHSNRAGGITGGMSTGQRLVLRAAMKPIATLMRPLDSVNSQTGEAVKAHIERSDVCAVPAAAVIGEALMALVLAEALLDKFGGDSMDELKPRVLAWQKAYAPKG